MTGGKPEFKFYVAGAGLPRTGTLTLKKALETLLPGKCMHMFRILEEDTFPALMDFVFNEEATDEEFKNCFIENNIVAGVDAPFISVYKRALKVFPNAKVILTVRDADAWVESMKRTVCTVQDDEPRDHFPLTIVGALTPSWRRFRKFDLEEPILNGAVNAVLNGEGVNFYSQWVADVKRTVPPEQLLIYQVKDGWEPLCKFLNLPIPNKPFPRSNDANEFHNIFRKRMIKDWSKLLLLMSLPAIAGFIIVKRNNVMDRLLDVFGNIKNALNIKNSW